MEARTVGLIILYVLVGFLVYVWLAIPAGAGWDGSIRWGDVATWASSIATAAAVIVALRIASKEGQRAAEDARTRELERAQAAALEDFRVSVLVLPALANAIAASGGVVQTLATGVMEFPQDQRDQFLEVAAFTHLASLAADAKGASASLAFNLLSCVSYAHQMVLTRDTCFELEPVNVLNRLLPRNYVFTGPAARRHIEFTAHLVLSYATAAKLDAELVIKGFTGERKGGG